MVVFLCTDCTAICRSYCLGENGLDVVSRAADGRFQPDAHSPRARGHRTIRFHRSYAVAIAGDTLLHCAAACSWHRWCHHVCVCCVC